MRQTSKPGAGSLSSDDARPGDELSAHGRLPGVEFPKAVYRSVVAAFGFILLASWAAFGGGEDSDLALGFASVLTIVFFALPIIMRKTAAAHSDDKLTALPEFLRSPVEIATGTLTGAEAWLQVLIIPLALAFAAAAIGAVYVMVA
jgi:hypothetical protein